MAQENIPELLPVDEIFKVGDSDLRVKLLKAGHPLVNSNETTVLLSYQINIVCILAFSPFQDPAGTTLLPQCAGLSCNATGSRRTRCAWMIGIMHVQNPCRWMPMYTSSRINSAGISHEAVHCHVVLITPRWRWQWGWRFPSPIQFSRLGRNTINSVKKADAPTKQRPLAWGKMCSIRPSGSRI